MKTLYTFVAAALLLTACCLLPIISNAQKIAGGGRYSLAVCSDSTVRAWGWNNYGELGNGNSTQSNVPVPVTGLSGITAIAGAYAHSLAVKNDGTAWAWGNNTSGELGNGTTGGISNVPLQVSSLSGIIAIAGGVNHSIALKNNGTVWTWGYNLYGQLGNGTTNTSNVPVQVTGLTGIIAVAAGNGFCLALKNDSTVWSWGWNIFGSLGNGNTTDSHVPVQVTGLTGVIAIAAAASLSPLALKNNSTVWSWGSNSNGELGDSTTNNSNVPVQVHGPGNVGFLTGITAIATGDSWSLALKNDNTEWAWGYNAYGQLGDSSLFAVGSPVPQQVHGIGNMGFLTGVIAIAAGYGHSIAMKNDSTVLTWGWNSFGQIGDGTTNSRNVPVLVTGMCPVVTSVNEITEPLSISIFPNPFFNNITIRGTSSKGEIIVFDITGKEILRQKISKEETTINTENFSSGFYLLNYSDGNKTANIKLVKF